MHYIKSQILYDIVKESICFSYWELNNKNKNIEIAMKIHIPIQNVSRGDFNLAHFTEHLKFFSGKAISSSICS